MHHSAVDYSLGFILFTNFFMLQDFHFTFTFKLLIFIANFPEKRSFFLLFFLFLFYFCYYFLPNKFHTRSVIRNSFFLLCINILFRFLVYHCIMAIIWLIFATATTCFASCTIQNDLNTSNCCLESQNTNFSPIDK